MNECIIYCADNMTTGRWYKIFAYLREPDDSIPVAPYNVTYQCDNEEIAYLVHDTVYIKKTGDFEITARDMYGNLSKKTIHAIEVPKIFRSSHIIVPESWEDLKEKISQIGNNAYVSIKKGQYDFQLDNTGIIIPEGTVIDFNRSEISISSDAAEYKGFIFQWNYSGIKNAIFNGNMKNDYSYSEQCTLISIISGSYQEVKNLIFNDVAGFNITIGTWPNYWTFKPSYSSGRWVEENNFNGHINENGEIVADSKSWTMKEMAESIVTEDRSFCVGQSNMWLPCKMYDIAFYDKDKNFIQLMPSLMCYRKYYYPENTKYFRIAIYQDDEPTNSNGRDDLCIMRMMGGISGIDRFTTVEDLWMDNIVCNNHASGGLSIVGVCQDIHINRMRAIGNGWKNDWAFDIEDSWNSSIGIVLTHSYFGTGTVVFHGSQGLSVISSIMGTVGLRSLIQAPTIINSICSNIGIERLRNNLTLINSYSGFITKQEDYEYVYSFGDISQEDAKNMRTIIENVLN